ncbi:c-type cytochrome [Azospirillum sp. sgz301742]
MSARVLILCGLMALAVAGCRREERETTPRPAGEQGPGKVVLSDLYPGGAPPPNGSHRRYEENAYHMNEGKRLFSWFNCNGCHAQGGGGIGPPLMDEKWIYGSEPENIYATIVEGRPNGMPSFRGRIPDQQVWQLVAYVRSLSGQAPKDAAPSRDDHMNAKPSEQQTPGQTPQNSGLPTASERRE